MRPRPPRPRPPRRPLSSPPPPSRARRRRRAGAAPPPPRCGPPPRRPRRPSPPPCRTRCTRTSCGLLRRGRVGGRLRSVRGRLVELVVVLGDAEDFLQARLPRQRQQDALVPQAHAPLLLHLRAQLVRGAAVVD